MKLITTSWDDGHPLDFRIAELLHKYSLAGTFYIPKTNAEHEVMPEHDVAELAKEFEIGGHTLSHIRLRTTDTTILEYEIAGCRKWLSDLTGHEPASFCFPGGIFHQKAVDVVCQSGYQIIRTTELLSTETQTPKGLVPTTLQVYEHKSSTYAKHLIKKQRWTNMLHWLQSSSLNHLPALTESYLDRIAGEGGCFHLWGHSWEIEEYNLWARLEELFRILSGRDDFRHVENKDLLMAASRQVA